MVTQRVSDPLRRLLRTTVPILQTAVAASLAFWIAHSLIGHPEPFFAPIAAVLSLGVSLGQRTRRSFELVIGVALGVLVADLLAEAIGRGTWQIALFVALALAIAVLAGGGPLVANQGAASAILIATLAPYGDPGSFGFSRFIDALIGGAVGIAVNALLMPLNPVVIARRAANRFLDELAGTLDQVADAMDDGDVDAARAALHRAVETEGRIGSFSEELSAGREITRIAPVRWRLQGHLAQYVDAQPHLAYVARDIRLLARRAAALVRGGARPPGDTPAAVHRLAESVVTLRNELARGVEPRATRTGLLHAVELASGRGGNPVSGLSANVVVAQIRSIAADLLHATGLSSGDTDRMLERASRAGDA